MGYASRNARFEDASRGPLISSHQRPPREDGIARPIVARAPNRVPPAATGSVTTPASVRELPDVAEAERGLTRTSVELAGEGLVGDRMNSICGDLGSEE